MSQLVKRQRQKKQRQQWRRRIEQEQLTRRYESRPVYPERETMGYKP